MELSALERKNTPIDLKLGKRRCHFFAALFDWILFILAGNDNINKSLHEFEIQPDQTMDYRVSCP